MIGLVTIMKNSTNLFQKDTSSNTLELLSKDEKTKFRECEKVIEKGWNTFVDVGKALTDIRDKRLYRQEFKTFESYCRQKWSFGKAHAYRYIGAAEVIEDLSPIGDKLPVAESQVRPLISVPRSVLQFQHNSLGTKTYFPNIVFGASLETR
jgi:hypothetical protein